MSESHSPPIIVIGFGGHGRVVADAIIATGRTVIAATDHRTEDGLANILGIKLLDDDSMVQLHPPGTVQLALGLGSIWPCDQNGHRYKLTKHFEQLGYSFTGFIHPSAWVSPWSVIDPTAQIHAGVTVQPGTKIGAHTIINTAASIDHDCIIGSFCHIGPGATLSGNVRIEDGCHLGTGSVIIQGISINAFCFVAAGSTVTKHVLTREYVRGSPAKPFTPRS
jgi:sugar O-acyltransferase (sialic acid O-acetyltransferase NeuD family)